MRVDVTIAQGTYRGIRAGGVARFKGVPYARSPVGELRFAAPVPPEPGSRVWDATRYGPTVPAPPQRSAVIDALLPDPVVTGPGSPLNLNIWTPDPTAALPVLVWIHGGGFVTGTGSVTAFDGSSFAQDGVVTVVINYRLALDGFLAVEGAVPNRGLLDQIAALTWVRDNIGAFGGDPNNVTVAGESAGGMSVMTLLAMPRARGLFRRAVCQSGDAHHVHTAAEAALVAEEVCARLGIANDAHALDRVPADHAHEALNEVISTVSAGADPRWRPFRRLAVQPVVDGDVLPEHPVEALAHGAGRDVDLLIGSNTNEYGLFVHPTGLADLLDEPMLRAQVARLGVDAPALIAGYRALLPGADPAGLFSAIQGDWFCALPLVRAVEARALGGADSHVYEFDWCPPTYGGRLGACHTLEIPFVFDTLADPWGRALRGGEAPQHLADEVHATWVRFASGGEPGWPLYGPGRTLLRLAPDTETSPDAKAERLALWQGAI